MIAYGGESPTRKANARPHVAHAPVPQISTKKSPEFTKRGIT